MRCVMTENTVEHLPHMGALTRRFLLSLTLVAVGAGCASSGHHQQREHLGPIRDNYDNARENSMKGRPFYHSAWPGGVRLVHPWDPNYDELWSTRISDSEARALR